MVQDGSFIIPLFKFFLQNKCLTESVYIFPQPDILPVHFFITSFKLKYTDFINVSSVGYSDFVFVYFLNCLFRLSIGFVVSISFLIFVSYLKYVVNSFQLLLHEFITAIYFFPHFSFQCIQSVFCLLQCWCIVHFFQV